MRPSALLSVLLSVLLCPAIGCAPLPIDAWQDARDACDLQDDDHPTGALLGGEPDQQLSRSCARWLADDLGLDWHSFDAQPAAVTGTDDTLSLVLLGAHQLVAGDFGTVGELQEALPADSWAQDPVSGLVPAAELDDDEPAGRLLYAIVLRHIRRVRLDPSLEGVGAVYDGGTMRVAPTNSPWDAPPLWMATVLVHEASHAQGPRHQACTASDQDGCDPDLSGIYGLQAQVLLAHLQALDPSDPLAAASCRETQTDLGTTCHMVNAPGDDLRCDTDALADRCTALARRQAHWPQLPRSPPTSR